MPQKLHKSIKQQLSNLKDDWKNWMEQMLEYASRDAFDYSNRVQRYQKLLEEFAEGSSGLESCDYGSSVKIQGAEQNVDALRDKVKHLQDDVSSLLGLLSHLHESRFQDLGDQGESAVDANKPNPVASTSQSSMSQLGRGNVIAALRLEIRELKKQKSELEQKLNCRNNLIDKIKTHLLLVENDVKDNQKQIQNIYEYILGQEAASTDPCYSDGRPYGDDFPLDTDWPGRKYCRIHGRTNRRFGPLSNADTATGTQQEAVLTLKIQLQKALEAIEHMESEHDRLMRSQDSLLRLTQRKCEELTSLSSNLATSSCELQKILLTQFGITPDGLSFFQHWDHSRLLPDDLAVRLTSLNNFVDRLKENVRDLELEVASMHWGYEMLANENEFGTHLSNNEDDCISFFNDSYINCASNLQDYFQDGNSGNGCFRDTSSKVNNVGSSVDLEDLKNLTEDSIWLNYVNEMCSQSDEAENCDSPCFSEDQQKQNIQLHDAGSSESLDMLPQKLEKVEKAEIPKLEEGSQSEGAGGSSTLRDGPTCHYDPVTYHVVGQILDIVTSCNREETVKPSDNQCEPTI